MTEEERASALRLKRQMEEMMATDGWKTLVETASKQCVNRQNEILLKPTEKPYEQEYLKGEIAGIRTLVDIPKVLVESAKATIDLANAKLGDSGE